MVPFVFIFDKTNVEFRESVLDSATTLSLGLTNWNAR